MGKFLKIFGIMALFGVVMMGGGCGGSDDAAPPATVSQTTPAITATVNPNGTVTTPTTSTNVTTAPGTPGYLATVSATLAPSTVITALNADGSTKALTAPPSFTFAAPADSTATKSGIMGIPARSGFALASTGAAIYVELTGAASATFNPPITITMPAPAQPVGAVLEIWTFSGGTWTNLGNYTVTTAGFISVPMSHFSWLDNPHWVTGSQG